MKNFELRQLAVALLDDKYGIGEKAIAMLRELLERNPANQDILDAIKPIGAIVRIPNYKRNGETRWYLPSKKAINEFES